jgi:hypothetical protein
LRVVLRRGFAVLVERFAAGFRAVDARPGAALADFARVEVAFFAVPRLAVDRFAVERFAAGLRAAPLLLDEEEPVLALAVPSIVHLPDMMRWAASATASAISEPSLVALAIILLAAWEAESAASSPASRIARRALGLALIAAAAAASPAASISLLIAALASLSTVSLPLPEDDFEDVVREDLAIASISRRSCPKRHFKPVTVPEWTRKCPNSDMLKGTAAVRGDALRHGQRPKVWPFVSD